MRPANKTAIAAVDAKCDTSAEAPLPPPSEPWLEEPEVELVAVVFDLGTAILFT